MISRQWGNVIFECDTCGADLNTDEQDFKDALQVLRDNGWRARKVDARV